MTPILDKIASALSRLRVQVICSLLLLLPYMPWCYGLSPTENERLKITVTTYPHRAYRSNSVYYTKEDDKYKLSKAQSTDWQNKTTQLPDSEIASPKVISAVIVEELKRAISESKHCTITGSTQSITSSADCLTQTDADNLLDELKKKRPQIWSVISRHNWVIEPQDLRAAAIRARAQGPIQGGGRIVSIELEGRQNLTATLNYFPWEVRCDKQSWITYSAEIPKAVSRLFSTDIGKSFLVSPYSDSILIDNLGPVIIDANAQALWVESTNSAKEFSTINADRAQIDSEDCSTKLIDLELQQSKESTINTIIWHTTFSNGLLDGSPKDFLRDYEQCTNVANQIKWLQKWKEIDSSCKVCTWIADGKAARELGTNPPAICIGLSDAGYINCYIYPSKTNNRLIVDFPHFRGSGGSLRHLQSSPGSGVPDWLQVDSNKALISDSIQKTLNTGCSTYMPANTELEPRDFASYLNVRKAFHVDHWGDSTRMTLKKQKGIVGGALLYSCYIPMIPQDWSTLQKLFIKNEALINSSRGITRWQQCKKNRLVLASISTGLTNTWSEDSARKSWRILGLKGQPVCAVLGTRKEVACFVFLSDIGTKAVVVVPTYPEKITNPWDILSVCAYKIEQAQAQKHTDSNPDWSAHMFLLDGNKLPTDLTIEKLLAIPGVKHYDYAN